MALPILDDAGFKTQVLESDAPILVDFMATWCGPCKSVAETLEALAPEYEGKVKIVKVDIDNAQETAASYGITSIPQVMLFKGGEVVQKELGAKSPGTYRAMMDAHS